MNSKTDLFLNLYKELESFVSAKYHLDKGDSAVGFLLRQPEYRELRDGLDYCREVRNLLSHNPKIRDRYPVEPSDEMVALMTQILERVRKPRRAMDIWVPREQVTCKTMHDRVLPTMREMDDHVYTHIPILEKGRVVGVFSENTLLKCLLDEKAPPLEEGVQFRQIAPWLDISLCRCETFRFVGKRVPVTELRALFARAEAEGQRIGLLFVTANGRPTEKLLGIISPWDMAGKGE